MQQLFFIFSLFIVAAYWYDTIRVRELAHLACKKYCHQHDVQLLDNTVIFQRLSFKKIAPLDYRLFRQYRFEYSDDGEQRHQGIIFMRGHFLHEIQMDLHTFDNRERDESV